MADRAWTSDQKKVIDLRNRNILVSAAAGSGKTAVLVERIVSMIMEGTNPINIDELLIVTFTNAAAAEMRERIGDAIAKKMQQEPQNDHLKRQQTLLHNAMITTIDSFCMNVVRNHFHLINLDPVFRLGDEVEMELMKSDVLHKLLEQKYEEGEADFLQFVECYAGGKTDSKIEEIILQLYQFAESNPWPDQWIDAQNVLFQAESLEQMNKQDWMMQLLQQVSLLLVSARVKAEHALNLCMEADGPAAYAKTIQADLDLFEEFAGIDTYERYGALFESLTFTRLSGRPGADVSEEKKMLVKQLRDEYKDSYNEIRDSYFFQPYEEMIVDMQRVRTPMQVLTSLTKEFATAYAKMKEEKNILDFSDVEHDALRILTEQKDGTVIPTKAAIALSEQFVEIMIDEYQDSNLVQETILTSISRERDGHPNIFMVGDVKQSIYKFRLARPELFMEKYETYTTEDSLQQKVDLSRNFRSRATVLNSVNCIFEFCMSSEFGRIAYDKAAALYTGKQFIEELREEINEEFSTDYSTELILLQPQEADEEEETELELDAKEAEAFAIARRIKALVHEKTGLLIEGKDGLRPADYGDITILLRTMSGWAETMTNILLSEGIPTYSDTKTGFFQTGEVQTVLNYLRILDNPRQDIPFTAVLHSPMVRLESEDLARIRVFDRTVYESVRQYLIEGTDEALKEKLEKFITTYDFLRSRVVHERIHSLLLELYEKTGFYYLVSLMPAGDKRRANLDMLVSRAGSFEDTSYHGLFHFVRYVERLMKFNIDYGEAIPSEDGMQAVRIMSIHRSKGLEFPVVILGGIGKKFNTRDAKTTVVFHPDLGIGPECVDEIKRTKVPTLLKTMIQSNLVLENVSEEMRILYVAMTRAKEKLIMVGNTKNLQAKINQWRAGSGFETADYGTLTNATSYLDFIGAAVFRNMNEEIPIEAGTKLAVLGFSKCTDESVKFQVSIEAFTGSIEELMEEQWNTARSKKVLAKLLDCSAYQAKVEEELGSTIDLSACMKHAEDTISDKPGETTSIQQELLLRLQYCYPYEAAAKLPIKMSVSELKHRAMAENEEEEEAVRLFPVEKEKIVPNFLKNQPETKMKVKGSDRGTLYHKVMECIPLLNIYNRLDLEEFLAILVKENKIQQEELLLVQYEKLLGFLDNPIADRMKQAERCGKLWREQPFVFGIPSEETDGEIMLIQGIMDVFFEEEDGLVLLDYKTDAVGKDGADLLKKRYQEQLELYANALGQITGKPVKERLIYSFALERILSITKEE